MAAPILTSGGFNRNIGGAFVGDEAGLDLSSKAIAPVIMQMNQLTQEAKIAAEQSSKHVAGLTN